MRILWQIKALSIFSVAVLVVLIPLFVTARLEYETEQKNDALASALLIKFFERTSIRDQYFLFHDEYLARQWQENKSKSDQLIIEALNQFSDNDENASIKNLREAINDTQIIFQRIVENSRQLQKPSTKKFVFEELDKRLSSQLLMKAYTVRNIILELTYSTKKKLDASYERLIFIATLLVVTLAIAVASTLSVLGRAIRQHLAILNDGAMIIASGNLNYRIASQGPAEFVELAGSINTMTDKLVNFTKQLENELQARRQVELELRASEEQLRQIAHHDALTRLPNRLLLDDRLRQTIAQNQRAGEKLAVCYLDLDGFKAANDTLGHQAGDAILREVAHRLSSTVREGDTVARLGGDEFVVVLGGLSDDDECLVALDRILKSISEPYEIDGLHRTGISASIGVTLFPTDAVDADTLIRHADHAMYAAKQAGKNRFQLFDAQLERRIEARLDTVRRVEEARVAGELRLFYQPKVDCRKGQVVGLEALIRWQHPTLGLLSPDNFLPLIENTDVALLVGKWVFREALRQIDSWQREGLSLRISVNAFVRQLLEADFAPSLQAMLEEFPSVDAHQLQIEIVESASLNELGATRVTMEMCTRFGIGFALDDFGTGYSSLAYIRHLPAEEIKIDQTFVRDMLIDANDEAIVSAVIGLSRNFGRSVVAEGAETPAHIMRLLALGCDVIQGYALAKPMPACEIPDWVEKFKANPNWCESFRAVSKEEESVHAI